MKTTLGALMVILMLLTAQVAVAAESVIAPTDATSIKPSKSAIPKKSGYTSIEVHNIQYPQNPTAKSVPTPPAPCSEGQKVLAVTTGKAQKPVVTGTIPNTNTGNTGCSSVGCESCEWHDGRCGVVKLACMNCINNSSYKTQDELFNSCKKYNAICLHDPTPVYSFADDPKGRNVITSITCGTMGWVDYTSPNDTQ